MHNFFLLKQTLYCNYDLLCFAYNSYLCHVLSQFTVIAIIIVDTAIVKDLSN